MTIRGTMKTFINYIFICFLLFVAAQPALAADWQLKFSMSADINGKSALYPGGLYVDNNSERYYIVDSGHNRLLSFDKSGKPLHSFDANKSLKRPIAMSRDRYGRLIVLEKGRDSLTVIDLKSKKIKSHHLAGRGIFPQRLSLLGKKIYVLDKVSGTILALDNDFKIIRRFKCKDCELGFADMQVSENGEVFGLARQEDEVWKFADNGQLLNKVKLSPPPKFAAAFAISPVGKIFVAERHLGKIKVYAAQGEFLYEFLSRGEGEAQLFYPAQIDFDPWGRLCVLDEGNGRLAVFGR